MRRSPLLALAAVLFLAACGPNGPATLTFVDVTPALPKIGDVTTVRFAATDYRGVPMAGADVKFSLLSPLSDGGVSGVTLNPIDAPTNKGDGMAQTQLVASNRINAVIVVATSGDKTALSPPISFAGAIPSARNFTFQCGKIAGDGSGGIHAIRVFDDARNMIEGIKLKCVAHVADRNGNGLDGVEVSFLAEAGTIQPSGKTVTDVDGNVEVLYKSTYPKPLDVSPDKFHWAGAWAGGANDPGHIGDSANPLDFIAPLWMHPYEWVADPVQNYVGMFPGSDNRTEPNRADPIKPGITNNPRDNLVTLIAITTGEEAYFDDNGNGHFDPGKEQFLDSTEPFVDSNDNGQWDPGELFVDTNGNGTWDAKNGNFDESTLIWAKERMLWTGTPTVEDLLPPQPVSVLLGVPVGGLFVDHCQESGFLTHVWSDPWYNSAAQDGTQDGCSLGASTTMTGGGGGGFKALVMADPSTFGSGTHYTYPAAWSAQFKVADNHDCSSTLGGCGMVDCPFNPPAAFDVPVVCNQTSSMENGDVLTIVLPGAVGTVK